MDTPSAVETAARHGLTLYLRTQLARLSWFVEHSVSSDAHWTSCRTLVPSLLLVIPRANMGATISRPLVDGVGIVYPAYKTVLCLQDGGSGAECAEWLRYWAVFGAFRVFEYICDRLVLWCVAQRLRDASSRQVTDAVCHVVVRYRSPVYYPAKVALLIAMVNPSTEVKDKLYKRVVLPFVERHRARIDAALGKANTKLREVWALVWAYVLKLLRTALAALWFSSQTQPRAAEGERTQRAEGAGVGRALHKSELASAPQAASAPAS